MKRKYINKFNNHMSLDLSDMGSEKGLGYYRIPYNRISLITLAMDKINLDREYVEWLKKSFSKWWASFGKGRYENNDNIIGIILLIKDLETTTDSWSFFGIEKKNSETFVKHQIELYYEGAPDCGELSLEDWEINAYKYNL